MQQPITIKAYKFGNRLHYEWPAEIIEQTEDYVMVLCRANRLFTHHTKQTTFIIDYPSIELFFLKEWYTVAITFQSATRLMYYCNIAMPSKFDGEELSFIDMDIDYLKEPDEDWKIVDREEFEEHKLVYGYSEELISRVELAIEQLQLRVAQKQYPFDETIDIHFLESVL